MKKMLWSGRFEKGPAKDTIDFNSSENIELDESLIPYDIVGSLAHIKMLYQQEILSTLDYEDIRAALKKVYNQWKAGQFILKKDLFFWNRTHKRCFHPFRDYIPSRTPIISISHFLRRSMVPLNIVSVNLKIFMIV